MNDFIKDPNLPIANIKANILSPKLPNDVLEKLKQQNISLLFVKESNLIQKAVSHHSDMLAHHAGGRHIFLEKSQTDLYKRLKLMGFCPEFISETIKKEYPHDILLNTLVINKNVFCNTNYTSKSILSFYKNKGFNINHINQGYAKCSSLVLNKNALITDDISLYNACISKGIDTLLISKGDIVLEGLPYGFIGGCGGLIGKNKLALFGDYKTHTDAKKIEDFAKKHNINIISLAKGSLKDYGSLLPLM